MGEKGGNNPHEKRKRKKGRPLDLNEMCGVLIKGIASLEPTEYLPKLNIHHRNTIPRKPCTDKLYFVDRVVVRYAAMQKVSDV